MNPGPWAPGRAESRRTSHPGSPRRHDLPAQRPTAPSFPLGPCFLGPQLKQGLFCCLTGCWIPSDRDRAHPLPASLDRQPPGLGGDGFPGLTLRCLQGALGGPHDPLPVPDRLAGESGSRSTGWGGGCIHSGSWSSPSPRCSGCPRASLAGPHPLLQLPFPPISSRRPTPVPGTPPRHGTGAQIPVLDLAQSRVGGCASPGLSFLFCQAGCTESAPDQRRRLCEAPASLPHPPPRTDGAENGPDGLY